MWPYLFFRLPETPIWPLYRPSSFVFFFLLDIFQRVLQRLHHLRPCPPGHAGKEEEQVRGRRGSETGSEGPRRRSSEASSGGGGSRRRRAASQPGRLPLLLSFQAKSLVSSSRLYSREREAKNKVNPPFLCHDAIWPPPPSRDKIFLL